MGVNLQLIWHNLIFLVSDILIILILLTGLYCILNSFFGTLWNNWWTMNWLLWISMFYFLYIVDLNKGFIIYSRGSIFRSEVSLLYLLLIINNIWTLPSFFMFVPSYCIFLHPGRVIMKLLIIDGLLLLLLIICNSGLLYNTWTWTFLVRLVASINISITVISITVSSY